MPTLEQYPPFIKIQRLILHKQMRPSQQVALLFDRHDAEFFGIKAPWRAAANRLQKFVRDNTLEGKFSVHFYETDTPGVGVTLVTRKR